MFFRAENAKVMDRGRVADHRLKPVWDALYKDDRNYFRSGAETKCIDGWKIVRVGGFFDLPASCVLERDGGNFIPPDAVLERLASEGVSTARFYVSQFAEDTQLVSDAFVQTDELGFAMDVRSADLSLPNPELRIRPLKAEDDPLKVALYESRPGRPDGKESSAEDFVRLERIKIDAGYMRGFLIEHGGEPAACFGLSVQSGVVRMKNLLTAYNKRGLGCGQAIVHFSASFAKAMRVPYIGVFAIKDSAGQRLYERCGLRCVGVQSEFAAQTRLAIDKRVGL